MPIIQHPGGSTVQVILGCIVRSSLGYMIPCLKERKKKTSWMTSNGDEARATDPPLRALGTRVGG